MLNQSDNGSIKKDPKILKYWLTNEISSSINHTVIKLPHTNSINNINNIKNIKNIKKN